MSYLREQLASLQQELADLKASQVRYVNAPVVESDSAESTFAISVNGTQGGTEILRGLDASKHHLPGVGTTARIALVGGQPVFQPGEIAPGSIGDEELSEPVKELIDVALETANGKNKVTFSQNTPTTANAGVLGDLWFQRDGFGLGRIIATWEFTELGWVPRTFNDSVLASLTVGKLVGGTGVFDMLLAGSIYSATSGSRYRIDSTGIKLWSGSGTTPTVDLNAVTGNATFRGIVEGALIRTSATGQRLEIQSGSRAITFYPAGNGGAASFFSADDGSGNAGVTARAGTATGKYGFLNFTSTFADIGYWEGSSATAYVRANPATSTFGVEVSTGKDIALTTPRVRWFAGAATYAALSVADGLSRVSKFSLNGPADLGGAGTGGNFTFGFAPGASDADVYALRFISTNPGATGGFVYFSDRRLKKNVRSVTFDALAEILATPVREFEWESTGEKGFGFVAQEVPADVQVRLSPDSPIDGVDNPVGVASEQMIAKLVKAVQQLNQKVDDLSPKGPKK